MVSVIEDSYYKTRGVLQNTKKVGFITFVGVATENTLSVKY